MRTEHYLVLLRTTLQYSSNTVISLYSVPTGLGIPAAVWARVWYKENQDVTSVRSIPHRAYEHWKPRVLALCGEIRICEIRGSKVPAISKL